MLTGCTGGVGRGRILGNGIGSGGGYGGTGGYAYYNGTRVEGGLPYGDADFPCHLGSGGGNAYPTTTPTPTPTPGGGVLGLNQT